VKSRAAILALLAIASFLSGTLHAQWHPTNGPYSGSIRLVQTLSTGEVFASDPYSAVYRSTDHGDHWTEVLAQGATEIAEAPNGDIYAGCGVVLGDLFRSRDRGLTWTRIPFLDSLADRPLVRRFAITPQGTIFLRTISDYFFRSTDEGKTWEQLLLDSNGGLRYTPDGDYGDAWGVVSDSAGIAYFVSFNEMFISSDQGASWVDKHIPCLFIADLTLLPSGDGFAASGAFAHMTPHVDTCEYIHVSKDSSGADVWVGRDHTLFFYTVSRHVPFGHISFSIDTARTFTTIDSFAGHPVNYFTSDRTGIFYAALENLGVYRSTDRGKTWTAINNGLTGKQLLTLAANARNELIASNSISLFYSSDKGDRWTTLSEVDYQTNGDDAIGIDPTGVIMSYKGVGISTTYDRGNHWITATNVALKISHFSFDSNGNTFASTEGRTLYRSSDRGANWDSIHLPFLAVGKLGMDDSNWLYSGSRNYGIWQSRDHGATWILPGGTLADSILDLQLATPTGILIATPRVTAYKGYYRSSDRGRTWDFIPGHLWTAPKVGRTVWDYRGGIVTLSEDRLNGTYDTVYRSLDGGLTWTIIPGLSQSFPTPITTELVATGDGTLYTPNTHQILRADALPQERVNSKSLDVELSLFPNPVSDKFTLVCPTTLAERSEIEVLDPLGRVLLREDVVQEVDVSSLPQGAYYARLRWNGKIQLLPFIKQP